MRDKEEVNVEHPRAGALRGIYGALAASFALVAVVVALVKGSVLDGLVIGGVFLIVLALSTLVADVSGLVPRGRLDPATRQRILMGAAAALVLAIIGLALEAGRVSAAVAVEGIAFGLAAYSGAAGLYALLK